MSVQLFRIYSARASAWFLFVAVAGAPLPFGSNDRISIAFWCVILGISLLLAPARRLERRQLILLALTGVVILAYAFVLHEQLSDRPWLAAPQPIWHDAAEALGRTLKPSVSIAKGIPFYDLGRPLVAMLAFLCGFLVGADRKRARRLLNVIAWSGSAYAIYGIVSYLIDPTLLLWLPKPAYLSSVTGTFVNRNTAATYFGSCSIVWLMLLAERLRRYVPGKELRWSALTLMFSKSPWSSVSMLSFLFVTLAAMFMTGSRAGVTLSLMAMILSITVYFRRYIPRQGIIFSAAVAASATAIILFQFLGAKVADRVDLEGVADEGRFETYLATLRLIAAHPWFGTGQGTFASSYPADRSTEVSMAGVWNMAHNSLLEIAADMGVPIALTVTLAWVVVFLVLAHGIKIRRRDHMLPVTTLSVAILAVLHSMVDFSLQIPGYAIVVFALVGSGLAQSARSARSNRRNLRRYKLPVDSMPSSAQTQGHAVAK